jgi:hypothetical protein
MDPQTAKHPPRKKTHPTTKHPQRTTAMTLSAAKHLPKRRSMTTTAKHPPKEKAIAAKHLLVATPARSSAVGQTIVVEQINTHVQLGTSPGARDVDDDTGTSKKPLAIL